MMRRNVLAVVVLPDETRLLELDVAGNPAGRHLLESLSRCDEVDIQLVVAANTLVPAWCEAYPSRAERLLPDRDTGDRAHPHTLVIDGRAWLSDTAVATMIRRARETSSGFRVIESGSRSRRGQKTLLLAVCPPRETAPSTRRDHWPVSVPQNIEQLLGVDVVAQTEFVDAADLDPSGLALLIDSHVSLATVEQHVLLERARDLLRLGVRLRDPGTVYVRGDVVCGAGVEIDIDVIFEGTVALGDQVRIGAHSILRGVQIGENTHIRPFSFVEQSRVGANGFVGPYGRIRPGCVIGDGVQIGNYVEIKSSRIGAGCRINHHSFIGDAVLADHVTIGAGTITCNHDGTGTNRTVIDRGAYIGSGCNLVAPLRIGGGATVGAGSTITRDVPAAKLTLARTPQTTIDDWQGPKRKVKEE